MAADLRISLQKLDVLVSVVRRGGVGRAAEAKFVAQPAVTGHIRSLEERLGTEIFYRDGRQLALTPAGRVVYAWAEDVLRRTRHMERELADISSGSAGRVAMAVTPSFGSYRLPAVLSEFQQHHPDAEVRQAVTPTDQAIEEARSGVVDLAFVASEPGLELPGLVVEPLGDEEIVLVTAADATPYAAAVSAAELPLLPLVEVPEGYLGGAHLEEQLRLAGACQRTVVVELGHPEAAKRAVRSEPGRYTLLWRTAVTEELADGQLVEIPVEDLELSVPIALVHRREVTLSPLHQRLVEAVRENLTSTPLLVRPIPDRR
jgi:LysR family transcriptional regulator, low CO2-responsive transcriptional regulator